MFGEIRNYSLAALIIAGFFVALAILFMPNILSIVLALGLGLALMSAINLENTFLAIVLVRASLDFLRETSRLSVGPVSLNITGFFSVFTIVLGFFYFFTAKKKVRFVKLFMPFFFFTGLCALSALYSPSLAGTAQEVLRFSSYIMAALLAANMFDTKEKIKKFMTFFFGAAICPLLVGFYQMATNTGIHQYSYNRLFGTLQHPSSYGKFLALYIILSLLFFMRARGVNLKFFWGALLGATGIQLILTFTRAAWVETIAYICALGFITQKKMFYIIFISALAIVLFLPVTRSRFSNELAQYRTSNVERRINTGLKGSYASRLMFNQYVFSEMFLKSPALGKGAGSFFYYYAPREFLFEVEAHNDLIKLLGEVGIIGTSLFFWGFIGLIVFLWRSNVYITDPELKPVFTAVTCIFAVKLIVLMIDADLRLALVQWYIWLLCGIAVSIAALFGKEAAGNAGISNNASVPPEPR